MSSALYFTLLVAVRRFLVKAFVSLQGDLHLFTKDLFNFLSHPPQEPLCPHTMMTAGWHSEEVFFYLMALLVSLMRPISSPTAFPQSCLNSWMGLGQLTVSTSSILPVVQHMVLFSLPHTTLFSQIYSKLLKRVFKLKQLPWSVVCFFVFCFLNRTDTNNKHPLISESRDCRSLVDCNLLPSMLSLLFLPGLPAVVSVVNHVMNHSLAKHPHISQHSSVQAPQRSLEKCLFKSVCSHSVNESTPLWHRSASIRSSSTCGFQPSPRHGGQPLLSILVDSGVFLDFGVERTKTLTLSQQKSGLQRRTPGKKCVLSISSSQIQGEVSWFRFHRTVVAHTGRFFTVMLEVH